MVAKPTHHRAGPVRPLQQAGEEFELLPTVERLQLDDGCRRRIGSRAFAADRENELERACLVTLGESVYETRRFVRRAMPVVDEKHDRQGNLQRVDEDIRLRAFVDIRYKPALEQAYGQVIASVPGTLINPRRPGDNKSGIHGSEVAPLVSESQFWWANSAPVQALLGKRVDFALTSVGGVRTEIAAGEWREGEAGLTLLPFKNPLTVLTLRGSDVRALVSETVTATLPAGSHAGKFPYGSRLRYVFQETVANKQGELVQLDWQDQNGQWQPIRDDVRYRVVMNSYCANGNDGWDALFRAQQQAASERVDLASVDGSLKAFPVEKISRRGDLVDVHYQGSPLDCAAKGVSCSTDAAAFTGFVREARNPLLPLQDKVVTLQRSR